MRTPQWIGYLIQRPESHCVHHRMGVHYYNYADFPVWDMLFGTFRNPREFRGECGFEAGADRQMGAMFGFADVNAPLYGPAASAPSRRRPPRLGASRVGLRPRPIRVGRRAPQRAGRPTTLVRRIADSRDNCRPLRRNQP